MKVVQTIPMNESTLKVLNELRAKAGEAQKTIEAINSRFTDILTGICLSNGINLETQQVSLSEDLTSLVVSEIEETPATQDTAQKAVKKSIKGFRAKK